MFSKVFNELSITLDLEPDAGPLLIKSGVEAGADPTLLDLNFVRSTDSRTGRRTVLLPGSSLKGAIRSHCERIARTVRPAGPPAWCCDPFADDSCGKRAEQGRRDATPAGRYRDACLACRTFGNTRLGSHVRVSDAFPVGEVTLEQRDGVAIDRVSGAVAAGPFNLEVVTAGAFRATLSLRNFQLWQVGWLALALRDLGAGLLPLGASKSKGFGRMRLRYVSAEVSYPGQLQAQAHGRDHSKHLYDLSAFGNLGDYGLAPVEPDATAVALPVNADNLKEDGTYGRVTVAFGDADTIKEILNATIGSWRAVVESGWPGGQR